jgi:hypothetical protein
MTELITEALEGFLQDPALYEQTLLELLLQNRAEFYRHSLKVIQSGGDTPAYRRLVTILVQNGLLVDDICQPALFGKELSIALAQQITEIEPKLDIRLARLLPDRNGVGRADQSGEAAERLLDLLEVTSPGSRLLPLITPLVQCPDPRVRARVALMVGRRLQNARSTEAMLSEPDSRVRANAVESVWGLDTLSTRSLLSLALKDSNQRVVANGMYGLYRLGDHTVIPKILKMAAHETPAYRVSAAWAMGETTDPRFLPALEKMSSDLYAAVRKTAVKALSRVRATEEAAGAAPRLGLSVLRTEKLHNGSCTVWLRIETPEGDFVEGSSSTSFILEEQRDLIIDYRITERHVAERLGVGFALCGETGISAEMLAAAEEAVTSCLQYRRADDCWAALKLASDDKSVPFTWHDAKVRLESDEPIEPPRYIVNNEALKHAVAATAVRSGARPAALDAVRMLLPGISVVRGLRHLIVLGGDELAAASDLHLVAEAALANQVAIHAVVPRASQPAIDGLCRRTGGTAIAAASPESLINAYKQIYLGLIDRYEIAYRPRVKAAPAEGSDPDSVRLRIFSPNGYSECQLHVEQTIRGRG